MLKPVVVAVKDRARVAIRRIDATRMIFSVYFLETTKVAASQPAKWDHAAGKIIGERQIGAFNAAEQSRSRDAHAARLAEAALDARVVAEKIEELLGEQPREPGGGA